MIYYILYMTYFVIKWMLGGKINMELTELTFRTVVDAIAVLIVIWFVIKNYLDMRDRSIKGFTRKQGWDKAAKVIDEKEDKWDKGLVDLEESRKIIVERYDKRLDDLESEIKENHSETDEKIGEIKSEISLLTECMRAVLDGLHQKGCNGKVTEASEKLDAYLVGLVGKD